MLALCQMLASAIMGSTILSGGMASKIAFEVDIQPSVENCSWEVCMGQGGSGVCYFYLRSFAQNSVL